MKFLIYIAYTFVLFLHCLTVFAQKDSISNARQFKYSFEIGGFTSINKELPFWLKNNQFGAVPSSANSIFFRQQISSKADTSQKFFKFKYSLDVMTVVGNEANLIMPEAFVDFKLGVFNVSAGRISGVRGLVDSTLSSGSVTWSGNALAIPEVRFGIPEYRKFLFKWLSVKGHYSHGWFGRQNNVEGSFLHQKSAYARLGTQKSKMRLYGGILHNVQWGGKPLYEVGNDEFGRLTNGRFASDWFAYSQVVFPFRAIGDSTSKNYAEFEIDNRFGNHVSQIDLGVDFTIKNSKLFLYKNNIIETGRTLGSLSNLDDGLYGISLHNQKSYLKKVLVELLYTKNQGSYNALISRLLNVPLKDYGNNAFYFNHQQYLDGWSYRGKTIGSPFLVPDKELKLESSRGYGTYSNSNRLITWYLASEWKLSSVLITTRSSFNKNFGSILFPIQPITQLSLGFDIRVKLKTKDTFIKANFGIDQGNVIKDNYGVNFSYIRSW